MKCNKNMSLGSHGVYRVRSYRKDTTRVRGTIFCINCIRLARLHEFNAVAKRFHGVFLVRS